MISRAIALAAALAAAPVAAQTRDTLIIGLSTFPASLHPFTGAHLFALLIALLVAGGAPAGLTAQGDAPPAPAPAAFVPLFDGETLAGFEQKGGKAAYAVEDGCIVGTTAPRTPNSFLCT
jgi:hypothetical protein